MSDRHSWARRLVDRVLHVTESVAPTTGAGCGLSDIEHVVIVMQENRSFDSYFGTLSGVRGFSDPQVPTQQVGGVEHPVFDQFGYRPGSGIDPTGFLQPFRLVNDPPERNGESINDITHDWAPQHRSWNDGAMDRFLAEHLAADPVNGTLTMGHYTRDDLSFYYALADAFTICDRYHCSVLGPTDPNRLMALSATIDPDGRHGGPVVTTTGSRIPEYYKLRWETMPERLTAAGIDWKVYNAPLGMLALSPLPYFKQYDEWLDRKGRELAERALKPTYPDGFEDDVEAGRLPAVSWIMPPLAECEHPAAPPEYGEHHVQRILNTLVSNPDIWASTVMFVVYDENGGFFDHVPPLTAPPGTDGEWLTVDPLPSVVQGITGPIGPGFRTPCLVVSPFSRGGRVCSEVFDHTSLLRFIETRFGVEVPNLSAWRRGAVGDLTATLSMSLPPDPTVPELPEASLGDTKVAEQAVLNALAGTLHVGIPYPPPDHNEMPTQETTPARLPIGGADPASSPTSPGTSSTG